MIVYNPEEDFAIQKEDFNEGAIDEKKIIETIALKVEKYLKNQYFF